MGIAFQVQYSKFGKIRGKKFIIVSFLLGFLALLSGAHALIFYNKPALFCYTGHVFFFSKISPGRPAACNFIKKETPRDSNTRYFLVNFAKFFRNPFKNRSSCSQLFSNQNTLDGVLFL